MKVELIGGPGDGLAFDVLPEHSVVGNIIRWHGGAPDESLYRITEPGRAEFWPGAIYVGDSRASYFSGNDE